MTDKIEKETTNDDNIRDLDNVCDECKKKEESVSHNLILTGF